MKNGLVHAYIGDGKGKTTAAVGLVIRALGRGLKVAVFHFMKNGDSGEVKILKEINKDNVYCLNSSGKFTWTMSVSDTDKIKKETENGLDIVKTIIEKQAADLIISDEILDAVENKIIDERKLTDIIYNKPDSIELVMTGRKVSEKILVLSDYVTEMKKIKHPFDRNIKSREGIEL